MHLPLPGGLKLYYGKGNGGGHAEMAAGFIPDIKTKKVPLHDLL